MVQNTWKWKKSHIQWFACLVLCGLSWKFSATFCITILTIAIILQRYPYFNQYMKCSWPLKSSGQNTSKRHFQRLNRNTPQEQRSSSKTFALIESRYMMCNANQLQTKKKWCWISKATRHFNDFCPDTEEHIKRLLGTFFSRRKNKNRFAWLFHHSRDLQPFEFDAMRIISKMQHEEKINPFLCAIQSKNCSKKISKCNKNGKRCTFCVENKCIPTRQNDKQKRRERRHNRIQTNIYMCVTNKSFMQL